MTILYEHFLVHRAHFWGVLSYEGLICVSGTLPDHLRSDKKVFRDKNHSRRRSQISESKRSDFTIPHPKSKINTTPISNIEGLPLHYVNLSTTWSHFYLLGFILSSSKLITLYAYQYRIQCQCLQLYKNDTHTVAYVQLYTVAIISNPCRCSACMHISFVSTIVTSVTLDTF